MNVELAHGGEGVEDGEGWSIVARTVGLFNTEPGVSMLLTTTYILHGD